MFDFVFGLVVCLPFGFFFGYFFCKYKNDKSELFENINLIKEDIAHLNVQLSNFVSR